MVSAELAVLEGIAVAAGTAVVLTAVLLAVRPWGAADPQRRRPRRPSGGQGGEAESDDVVGCFEDAGLTDVEDGEVSDAEDIGAAGEEADGSIE